MKTNPNYARTIQITNAQLDIIADALALFEDKDRRAQEDPELKEEARILRRCCESTIDHPEDDVLHGFCL